MGHPLEHRWEVSRKLLDAALTALQSARQDAKAEQCIAEYQRMLQHNELELALDMLELTETFTPPQEVWERLALAADSMDLFDRARSYWRMNENLA